MGTVAELDALAEEHDVVYAHAVGTTYVACFEQDTSAADHFVAAVKGRFTGHRIAVGDRNGWRAVEVSVG